MNQKIKVFLFEVLDIKPRILYMLGKCFISKLQAQPFKFNFERLDSLPTLASNLQPLASQFLE